MAEFSRLEKLRRWFVGNIAVDIEPQPVILEDKPLTASEIRKYLVTCKKMEKRITQLARGLCQECHEQLFDIDKICLCEDRLQVSVKTDRYDRYIAESFPIYALWDDDFKAREEREYEEASTKRRKAEYERLKEEFEG